MAMARFFVFFALCIVSNGLRAPEPKRKFEEGTHHIEARRGIHWGGTEFKVDRLAIGRTLDIVKEMQNDPDTPTVQERGCHKLAEECGRNQGQAGDEILPVFTAAADAIATGSYAALTCAPWLANMAYDNVAVTALLAKTNAYQNTLEFLQDRMQTFDGEATSFNTVASFGQLLGHLWESADKKGQLEGIGILFQYLERYPNDQKAIMMAYSGLQEIATTPSGAQAIAEYDPSGVAKRKRRHKKNDFKGVDFLMDTLHLTSSNLGAQEKDGLTARSELLQIASLMMNHTKIYDKAFLGKGLLTETSMTMRDESDKRAASSVSCELLDRLFQHGQSRAILPTLEQEEVANLLSDALKNHPEWKRPVKGKWNGMNIKETDRALTIKICNAVLERMP